MKVPSSGLIDNSSSTSQVSFGSITQDWSSVRLLSSLMMAQQVRHNFFKPNQPFQFDQLPQRVSQLENVLNDFRPNLGLLRVEHTCPLDIPNNDISAETVINLITKTLQSWSGHKDHNFLQLFQMLFTRLRNYNAVDDGDIDITSFKKKFIF